MNAFRMVDDGGWLLQFQRRGDRWVLIKHRRHSNTLVVLEWVAVTLVACAILVSEAVVALNAERPTFDAQSKAFADASVNAIAPSWNANALLSRGSPDFVASAPDQFQAYFARLAALGPDEKTVGCQGRSAIEPWTFYSPVTARYFCALHSKHRQAVVALSLSRDLDDWKITSFYVSPPELIHR